MARKENEPNWFEQVAPSLLRNKAIRHYLAGFNAYDWAEVVKLTMLYGIVTLFKQHGTKQLTLEQLREQLMAGAHVVTAESALPDVRDQLGRLRDQLEAITDDILHPQAAKLGATASKVQQANVQHQHPQIQPPASYSTITVSSTFGVPPPTQQQAAPAGVPVPPQPAATKQQQRLGPPLWLQAAGDTQAERRARSVEPRRVPARIRRPSNPIVAPLPSSAWRAGDDSRTWSPPGKKRSPPGSPSAGGAVAQDAPPDGAVYPSWWGDGSQDEHPGPQPLQEDTRPRHVPRLAYPVMPEPVPLFVDDLVTSKYLDVPGSGYGQQRHHPARAEPAPAPGVAGVAVNGAWDAPNAGFGSQAGLQPLAQGPGQAASAHPFAPSAPPMPPVIQPSAPASSSHLPGVPGGYPAAAQPAVVMMQHPSGVMVPVLVPPPAPHMYAPPQPQQQPAAAARQQPAGGESKPVAGNQQQQQRPHRKLNLSGVESRIKMQVAADRAAARQRQDARQRAIQSAMKVAAAGGTRDTLLQAPPSLQTPLSAPPASHTTRSGGPARSPATPSDIADSLASNPWTSWFMGEPPAGATPGEDPYPQVSPMSLQSPHLFADPTTHNLYQPPFAAGLPQAAGPPQVPYPSMPAFPGSYAMPPPPQMAWGQQGSMYPPPSAPPAPWYAQGGPAEAYLGNSAWGGAGHPEFSTAEAHRGLGQHQPEHPGVPGSVGGAVAFPGAGADEDEDEAVRRQAQEIKAKFSRHPQGIKWEIKENDLQQVAAAVQEEKEARRKGSPGPKAPAGVRPEVLRWSKSWVGDFGHMDKEPRFDPALAFQHHHDRASQGEEAEAATALEATAASLRREFAAMGLSGPTMRPPLASDSLSLSREELAVNLATATAALPASSAPAAPSGSSLAAITAATAAAIAAHNSQAAAAANLAELVAQAAVNAAASAAAAGGAGDGQGSGAGSGAPRVLHHQGSSNASGRTITTGVAPGGPGLSESPGHHRSSSNSSIAGLTAGEGRGTTSEGGGSLGLPARASVSAMPRPSTLSGGGAAISGGGSVSLAGSGNDNFTSAPQAVHTSGGGGAGAGTTARWYSQGGTGAGHSPGSLSSSASSVLTDELLQREIQKISSMLSDDEDDDEELLMAAAQGLRSAAGASSVSPQSNLGQSGPASGVPTTADLAYAGAGNRARTMAEAVVELAGALGGHTGAVTAATSTVTAEQATYTSTSTTSSSAYPVMRSLQAFLDAEGAQAADPGTPRLGGQRT